MTRIHSNTWQAAVLGLLAAIAGCTEPPPPPTEAVVPTKKLFSFAMDNLNQLEDFNSSEMVERIHRCLQESVNADPSADTLMAPWPEPEMLRRIVDRLNQWAKTQQVPPGWERDPLIASLPEPLAKLPLVQGLDKMEFPLYDGLALRETVWLREVSGWSRGDELDDLSRAKRLFDWTIRNVQLAIHDRDVLGREVPWCPLVPWENLFFGQGTSVERAWVFILLARQQGLDAAILAVEPPPAPAGEPPPTSRPEKPLQYWGVGVLIEGEVYVFEPALGLPIPAPDGIRLDRDKQLDVRPATLTEIIENPSVLRQLDLDRERYPLDSSRVKRVVALVEASPIYLARRMAFLESQLVGKQKMVLRVDAAEQAARFAKCKHVAEGRLWTYPYETLLRRSRMSREEVQRRLMALLPFYEPLYGPDRKLPDAPLCKARLLHLKGQFEGSQGAIAYYLKSRLSNKQLEASAKMMADNLFDMYVPSVKGKAVEEGWSQQKQDEEEKKVRQQAEIEAAFKKETYATAKRDASYWLGLVTFEQANYPSAIDYFSERTINATPQGPWTDGALYNLGRCYERLGQPGQAIGSYAAGFDYPSHFGNMLRAKWLGRLFPDALKPQTPTGPAKPAVPEPTVPEPPITEPKTPQPPVTEPKVSEPMVTEPKVTEPSP